MFPDLDETGVTVLDAIPPPPRRAGPEPRSSRCRAIRLAEPFEALRDASDRCWLETGARPKIFLANLGTLSDFTARATFAKNFFEAGGIEAVTSDERLATPDAMIAAFKASGVALACLCSSDAHLRTGSRRGGRGAQGSGSARISTSPAGRATARPRCKAAGVQSFIFEGCDVLATLQGRA